MQVLAIPVLRWLTGLLTVAGLVVMPAAGQTLDRLPVRVDRSPELKLEYQRAERAWKSGSSLAEAKTRLDRVLTALPEDEEARRLRARVLLDMSRFSAALDDARILTHERADDGPSWLLLCEALVRTGSAAEGLAALERAAALITKGVDDHIRLSSLAQELGQVDRAEAFARVALALGPVRPAAYRRLALVFMAQDRRSDAVTLLARGLDEGVIPPGMIPDDPVLAGLASDPALLGRLRP